MNMFVLYDVCGHEPAVCISDVCVCVHFCYAVVMNNHRKSADLTYLTGIACH